MNNNLNLNQKSAPVDEFELKSIIQQCLNKWHYFLISGIIFLGLGLAYYFLSLPKYESLSSVLIGNETASPQNLEDFISTDLFSQSTSIPTEIGVLDSRYIMQRTIEKLNLRVQYWDADEIPEQPLYNTCPFIVHPIAINRYLQDQEFDVTYLGNKQFELTYEYDDDDLPEFSISQKFYLGQTVSCKYFKFRFISNDTIKLPAKGASFEFYVRSVNGLVSDMLDNLEVDQLEKDANIITLAYDDVVPRRAIDVIDMIGKNYLEMNVQDKANVAGLTVKFVDEQLKLVGDQLSDNEKELQRFKEKNKTVDLSEESKAMLAKLQEIDVDKMKNDIELGSLDNLYEYVKKNKDLTNLAPSSLGIPDPLLIDLITNFQNLQSKRKNFSFGVKNEAPAVKILDQQIRETRESLLENIVSIKQQSKVTSDNLKSQLGEYDSFIKSVPDKERQLLDIQRKLEVNQNIYTYLLQKKAESGILQATAVSDNKILDPPALADEPVAPNKKLLAVIVFLLSGIFPLGFIVVKNIFRNKVENRDDISNNTSVPVVGIVGHSLSRGNLAVFERPKSIVAEGFRTIRTNLQFYGVNNGKKVILITSSVGGEGKSFVTINLATVFALQQKKVVIVGLDLRKPKLFADFSLKNDTGVSNYLSGNLKLDELINKTNIPFLDVITSGPIPPNPAELLSGSLMTDLVNELKERYDFILIDTPPIGIVSDAYLLFPMADIKLYIVRQRVSRIEYIKSLEILRAEGRIENFSIILNDSKAGRTNGYGYGHNYGYIKQGHGYYQEEEVKGFAAFVNRFRKKKI